MATERKRAIRSAAGWAANQAAMEALYGAGNYYTTLSAWEAAEQADLTALDEIRTAVCYRDWPAGLNDHLILGGWVSDATRYPRVTVAEGHRHGGIPNAGFWVSRTVDYDGPISVRQAYSRVEWVEARNTSTSGIAVTAGNAQIINCIARSGWFPNAAFGVSGSNGTYIQCLAYSSGRGFVCGDWASQTFLGCVSANNQTHGYMSGGGSSITVRNCVSYGNGEQAYQGTSWSSSSTHNATSSATDDAPGGNSVVGVTAASFVDAAANDMHLAAGSPLIGAGANLYAQITHDIDGDAWPSSGAWDIGFDHYVSGGGGPTLGTPSISHITASGFRVSVGLS